MGPTPPGVSCPVPSVDQKVPGVGGRPRHAGKGSATGTKSLFRPLGRSLSARHLSFQFSQAGFFVRRNFTPDWYTPAEYPWQSAGILPTPGSPPGPEKTGLPKFPVRQPDASQGSEFAWKRPRNHSHSHSIGPRSATQVDQIAPVLCLLRTSKGRTSRGVSIRPTPSGIRVKPLHCQLLCRTSRRVSIRLLCQLPRIHTCRPTCHRFGVKVRLNVPSGLEGS